MMMKHELFGGNSAWDTFISLIAVLCAVIVPLWLVLDVPRFYGVGAELVITLLFVADIVVRIRAGGYRGGSKPMRRYQSGGFLVDILAALPLVLISGPSVWQLLRVLKLYRVGGFLRTWRRTHIGNTNALSLAYFVFWLTVLAHWITCGWMALRNTASDTVTQYLDALYWTVMTLTTVGYGDVVPSNNLQTLYAVIVMIIGAGVYGYVVANIARMLSNMDPAKAAYLKERDQLSSFMRYRNLPASLQHRIHDYYDHLWEQQLFYSESNVLHSLSPSLQTEVSLALRKDIIENVPLFSGATPAFIRDVASELEAVVYAPGDYIIRAGQVGTTMFFINRGTADVLSEDGATVFRRVEAGDYFGEIALFLDVPRSASVKATSYCDLYRLDKKQFTRLQQFYPDVASKMERRARERFDR